MNERNGKKHTWTLGQQKRGELKRQGDQQRQSPGFSGLGFRV